MLLHIYKEGFAPQKVSLTSGPFEWVAVTGRHHGKYFLLKSQRFDITLDRVSKSSEESVEAALGARAGPIHPHPAASAFQTTNAAASDSGSVEIESDPPAADIYVDWKFAGQTPSTLRLAGGPHHIELKSRGRQTWERELQITNDSRITLRPILELVPASPPDH
jgi:PEGA domain